MALSKFKYVGGRDTGVNPDKAKTLYDIRFPLGKAVEVPDDVAHKLRTKAGRDGDEFEEVKVGAEKTEAELQQEKDAALLEKSKKKEEKLTPEEIEELKAVQAREQARTEEIRQNAKLGR
jgi:hypothetical protein